MKIAPLFAAFFAFALLGTTPGAEAGVEQRVGVVNQKGVEETELYLTPKMINQRRLREWNRRAPRFYKANLHRAVPILQKTSMIQTHRAYLMSRGLNAGGRLVVKKEPPLSQGGIGAVGGAGIPSPDDAADKTAATGQGGLGKVGGIGKVGVSSTSSSQTPVADERKTVESALAPEAKTEKAASPDKEQAKTAPAPAAKKPEAATTTPAPASPPAATELPAAPGGLGKVGGIGKVGADKE
jgi:hypothetical protein